MITILKEPKKKKVKLFKCPCGCEFTAEADDYTFCYSITNTFSYYTIECPFCHITRIYPYFDVEDIEVDIK